MTIVNQYPVMTTVAPGWVIYIFIILIVVFVYLAVETYLQKFRKMARVLSVFAVAFGVALFLTSTVKKKTGRNCYECLIDDTTPFVEVAENYDITGRRGELWILEDKADE